MAASKMTSLSVGKIIRKVLTEDATVSALVTKVFPVATDTARLPYVSYRRVSLDPTNVKGGANPDTTAVEVLCFTEKYESGVELAEAVRDALEGKQVQIEGLTMRSCFLSDSEEAYQDDAYVQQLAFTIKAS